MEGAWMIRLRGPLFGDMGIETLRLNTACRSSKFADASAGWPLKSMV